MTISSLAKFIAGVNRMVVEKVEIENPEINPTLIFSVRPTKKDSCRCPMCGKKAADMTKGTADGAGVHWTSEAAPKCIWNPIHQGSREFCTGFY